MLIKLQKKTLIFSQIIGYAFTLFIGVIIILVTAQFYFDVKPLLQHETDVLKDNSAIISKNISVFKTINKDKIYFTNQEIEELKKQKFIKSISKINRATFQISAISGDQTQTNVPIFKTDLFFESIPTEFLEAQEEDWYWEKKSDFIPIIIPESYLKLYNFGFAESQGLPVLSKNTISQWEFNLKIKGNGKEKIYKSRIVGFTNKFNSVLVPENFLIWANNEYGNHSENRTSRILLNFKNPSDETILKYFNENNYAISKDKLEFGKLTFFFKSALIFVFFIAIIIIILSVSFIVLSLNLTIQRNKNQLINLYNIGYNHWEIAKFYQIIISLITIISIVSSVIISRIIRNYYVGKIENIFEFSSIFNCLYLFGGIILLLLLFSCNILIIKNIKKILT